MDKTYAEILIEEFGKQIRISERDERRLWELLSSTNMTKTDRFYEPVRSNVIVPDYPSDQEHRVKVLRILRNALVRAPQSRRTRAYEAAAAYVLGNRDSLWTQRLRSDQGLSALMQEARQTHRQPYSLLARMDTLDESGTKTEKPILVIPYSGSSMQVLEWQERNVIPYRKPN